MVLGEDVVKSGAEFDESVKKMQGMVQGITSLVKEVGSWIKENPIRPTRTPAPRTPPARPSPS